MEYAAAPGEGEVAPKVHDENRYIYYERGDRLPDDFAADAYHSFPGRVILLDGEGNVVHSPDLVSRTARH